MQKRRDDLAQKSREALTPSIALSSCFNLFRFAPVIERDFLTQMRSEQRRSALISTMTALAIWVLFIGLDSVRADWLHELANGKGDAVILVGVRAVTTLVLLATVFALWRRWAGYPVLTFASVVTLAIAASICLILYKMRGLPGATLSEFAILMAVFLPLGLTFGQAICAAALVTVVIGLIGAVLLPHHEVMDHIRFAIMLMFTGFIGSVGAALRERSLREEFLLRRLLHEQATTDALTGVGNRRWFEAEAEAAFNRSDGANPLRLAILDIDDFKRFNDTYGHQAGDEALTRVAAAIDSCLSGTEFILGRMGGEEFAIVGQEAQSLRFERLLQQICSTVEALAIPHVGSSVSGYVTISAGATTAGLQDTLDGVFRRADAKLYESKTSGRNRATLDGAMTWSEAAVVEREGLPQKTGHEFKKAALVDRQNSKILYH